MIILTKDILKNEDELNNIIEKEKTAVNLIIDSQNMKKDILLNTKQRFNNYANTAIPTLTDSINFFLNNFENSLALTETNIYLLNNLLLLLDNLELSNTNETNIENFNTTFFETNKIITSNSLQIEKTLNYILTFSYSSENVLDNFMQNLCITDLAPKKELAPQQIVNETKSKNSDIENSKENTLIISEKENVVLLPYTISEVNSILENNSEKYSNIEDVIKDKFTLPYNSFKNSAMARFREAFKLMREKEKQSIKESIDLGIEMFFNYNLHPAIIPACKSLDELDIYLDCLEDNELNKFDCFKIVFDMLPAVNNKLKIFNLRKNSVETEF